MGFLDSCPFALQQQPAIDEVSEIYWWRKDGCVDPHSLPVPVRLAVSHFAAGIAKRYHDKRTKD